MPLVVFPTTSRPDICIVNEMLREVILFELTCPWGANIARSHAFKEDKYAPLVSDLSRMYKTYHFSIEVSVRGQVSSENKGLLKAFVCRACTDPKTVYKPMLQVCSKTALLSSFSVFSARNEPTWENPAPLISH